MTYSIGRSKDRDLVQDHTTTKTLIEGPEELSEDFTRIPTRSSHKDLYKVLVKESGQVQQLRIVVTLWVEGLGD